MSVVEKLLQEFAGNALRRLHSCSLDVMLFAVSPFLCLFGNTIPLPALIRVWDVLVLEPGEVLCKCNLIY